VPTNSCFSSIHLSGNRSQESGFAPIGHSAATSGAQRQLAGHLQTPDFFDAERFPEITFRAEGIEVNRGEVRGHGELTIKGVTQPVEFTGSITAPACRQRAYRGRLRSPREVSPTDGVSGIIAR
jgi:polyisoprenoid-binding protein YceI